MSNKLKELAGQALDKAVPYTWTTLNYEQIHELLACHAELIINECIQECQRDWYELNNARDKDDSTRTIAIKVGQKSEAIKLISKIKQHFWD